MKTKKENLDQVVFEKRNKNYGAYFLRRNQNKHVSLALFFVTLFSLGAFAIPLIAGWIKNETEIVLNPEYDPTNFDTPPDKDEKIELPPDKVPEIKIQPFSVPLVVDSSEVTDSIDLFDLIDKAKNAKPLPISDGKIVVPDSNYKSDYIDLVPDDFVYVAVGEMPDFIGGIDKMYAYLKQHMIYPKAAKDNRVSGRVHVKFVVEKDGSISNVTLLKDIGGGCGDEAMRVVQSMPKWKPGKQNGETVRVQYILPVHFILEN